MPEISSLIVDHFYEHPDAVRELALSLNYFPKPNAQYPGGEAYSDTQDWELHRKNIISLLNQGREEKTIDGKNFRQGKFRLALKEHERNRPDGVHQDQQKYSAIVYLSKNADCEGGVALYKCRITGETSISKKWLQAISHEMDVSMMDPRFQAVLRAHMKDWDNWQKIGELPMRFNRLIVLMAQCFHASAGIFGDSIENGRLTQHFEIYL